MSTVSAYVGLGANLGDAAHSVRIAIDLLAQLPKTKLSACSSLYRTAPIDATGDDFVNAAVHLDTQLDAHTLLNTISVAKDPFAMRPEPSIWICWCSAMTSSETMSSRSLTRAWETGPLSCCRCMN